MGICYATAARFQNYPKEPGQTFFVVGCLLHDLIARAITHNFAGKSQEGGVISYVTGDGGQADRFKGRRWFN